MVTRNENPTAKSSCRSDESMNWRSGTEISRRKRQITDWKGRNNNKNKNWVSVRFLDSGSQTHQEAASVEGDHGERRTANCEELERGERWGVAVELVPRKRERETRERGWVLFFKWGRRFPRFSLLSCNSLSPLLLFPVPSLSPSPLYSLWEETCQWRA